MPLIHQDSLYMVHSIAPVHRVLTLGADGRATKELTVAAPEVMQQFEGRDVHGGPPVVFIPPELAAAGAAAAGRNSSVAPAGYYLGILHFYIWEKVRLLAASRCYSCRCHGLFSLDRLLL